MNEHTSMTFVGSTGSAILSLLKDLPLEQYVIVLINIVYVIIFWYFFSNIRDQIRYNPAFHYCTKTAVICRENKVKNLQSQHIEASRTAAK